MKNNFFSICKTLFALLLALCLTSCASITVPGYSDSREEVEQNGGEEDGTAQGTLLFSVNDSGKGYVLSGYSGTVKELVIPTTHKEYPVTGIEHNAFYYCTSVTSVTVPSGIQTVGVGAFYCCASLSFVTMHEGVKKIDTYAFDGCSRLVAVALPKSLTQIGSYAFDNCTALETIVYQGTISEWSAVEKGANWLSGAKGVKIVCSNGTVYP